MKRKNLSVSLLLLGGLLLPAGWTSLYGQAQPRPSPASQEEQEEPYTEEEYDAYEKAVNETDIDKKAAALTAFMDKYPKSNLQAYITNSYATMLHELQQKQNYAKLLPLSEQWLKYAPEDITLLAYIAEAAQKTGNDRKFQEYGQKVYALKPNGNLAIFLAESFKKTGNNDKYLEWTEKCFTYFPENFELRMVFVTKYTEEKNFQKAAEYARLALKSVDTAKKPATTSQEDWNKAVTGLRRACHYIVGVNHYEKGEHAKAIQAMEDVLKVERFGGAYFYIALAQWKLDQVEEAINSFAKAYLLKGEVAPQAKEYLEKLYKALHNNTLIGVEKVYTRAERELNLKQTAAK